MDQTRAGVLIPHGEDLYRWLAACGAVADVEGWTVAEVVHTWEQLRDLLCDQRIEIGLVGRASHLPPGHTPRLVIAEEHQMPPPAAPGEDRPRRL